MDELKLRKLAKKWLPNAKELEVLETHTNKVILGFRNKTNQEYQIVGCYRVEIFPDVFIWDFGSPYRWW